MHTWKRFRAGGIRQPLFRRGEDIKALAELDCREWLALMMPVKGVRFDRRMLELMDLDHDGVIRTPEVIAAIEFLKERDFDFDSLFTAGEATERKLAEIQSKLADLDKVEPTEAERRAMADWEQKLSEVSFLGADTAAAEAALTAVEPLVDGFFTPPADMPLVTDEPDRVLPLADHLNPLHLEKMLEFRDRAVKPVLGERSELGRLDWKRVKAAFADFRGHVAARPVMCAGAKATLENEERVERYRLHLLEFLENFVSMRRLYRIDTRAIFQTGVLRIDAREFNLCFQIDNEAAHSALAEKSKCCLVYAKLTRGAETQNVCAVATAGRVEGLYSGRNGVFYDYDGRDWGAVVTKVVEAQLSLVEAFWAPWKKLGESVRSMVSKFLGERQAKTMASAEAGKLPGAAPAQNGAAVASSVAAIGIGIGMVTAAFATLMGVVKGMAPLEFAIAVVTVVAVVSLPSVILTWFKLRARDLGAILNASGWAINRPMRFSQRLAAGFTRCQTRFARGKWLLVIAVIAAVIAAVLFFLPSSRDCFCA